MNVDGLFERLIPVAVHIQSRYVVVRSSIALQRRNGCPFDVLVTVVAIPNVSSATLQVSANSQLMAEATR
jgi:hypothetical protein